MLFLLITALSTLPCTNVNAIQKKSKSNHKIEVKKELGVVKAQYNALPNNYNFWLYLPHEYKEKEHTQHGIPLIIYLHGASCCGTNLTKVKRYGTIDAIGKGLPMSSIVIAPQSQGAWNPKKLNELLEWMTLNYNVDKNRVYVVGMSLGGYGTMDFVNAYPEKIAAAIAFCGGCSTNSPDGLGRTCMWIMHGTADRAVGINRSKQVVSYLQNTGHDKLLRYDWLPGGSHGVYARYFYLPKLYDWLYMHSLDDNPRRVDKSVVITKEDTRNPYVALKRLQQQAKTKTTADTEATEVNKDGEANEVKAAEKTTTTKKTYKRKRRTKKRRR